MMTKGYSVSFVDENVLKLAVVANNCVNLLKATGLYTYFTWGNLELIKLLNNASKASHPPLERDISRELSLQAIPLLKACPCSFLSTTHCAAPAPCSAAVSTSGLRLSWDNWAGWEPCSILTSVSFLPHLVFLSP